MAKQSRLWPPIRYSTEASATPVQEICKSIHTENTLTTQQLFFVGTLINCKYKQANTTNLTSVLSLYLLNTLLHHLRLIPTEPEAVHLLVSPMWPVIEFELQDLWPLVVSCRIDPHLDSAE
jgi:hypothetical protein